jgi:CBS domain-containing protein
MSKQVRDVMRQTPVTLEPGTPVVEAARKMRASHVGAVILADHGKLFGIVTDRDIAVRAVAQGRDPATTPVSEICSKEPTTLSPDDDLDRAIEIMRQKAIRRIPVVDGGQRAIGILSLGDLALERDPRSVLGQISAARPNL